MSVQLENGYTRIADELLEQIPFYKFNGTQFSIIIVIIRFTYGFNRKDHDISLTFLQNATGATRNQIDRELKSLIEQNVIKIAKESTKVESRKLGINKHYDKWKTGRRCPLIRGQSSNQSIPKLEDRESPNQRTQGIPYLGDQDIQSFKENYKDITTIQKFESVLEVYRSLHNVMDIPNSDNPILSKMIKDGITPELIISVMTEKHTYATSQGRQIKGFKYYADAIRERYEGKERVVTPFKKVTKFDKEMELLRKFKEESS